MFFALAGSEIPLSTGTTQAPPPPVPSNDLFLSSTFVKTLATELALDPVFGPVLRGAAAALDRLVDWRGVPVTDPAHTPKGGTFLVRCGLLYRPHRRLSRPQEHQRQVGAGGRSGTVH